MNDDAQSFCFLESLTRKVIYPTIHYQKGHGVRAQIMIKTLRLFHFAAICLVILILSRDCFWSAGSFEVVNVAAYSSLADVGGTNFLSIKYSCFKLILIPPHNLFVFHFIWHNSPVNKPN